MGADSKIQWTHHTFNPWRGCTKVSDGCKNCYADQLSKRNPKTLGVWGPSGTRVVAADAAWREPLKWDKAAAKAGERHRVFCASLADVFEASDTMPEASRQTIREARLRLFKLIIATPDLDWLLLTKRPENVMLAVRDVTRLRDEQTEGDDRDPLIQWLRGWIAECNVPRNIWVGTSVENQEQADERIPHLLKCPAAVRFLSCEPLLGAIDLDDITTGDVYAPGGEHHFGALKPDVDPDDDEVFHGRSVNWVIVGGESGPRARPCNIEWIRSIVAQCKAAGVSCFVKQLGSDHYYDRYGPDHEGTAPRFHHPGLKDRKGGDPSEWPADLRVREMPASPAGGK